MIKTKIYKALAVAAGVLLLTGCMPVTTYDVDVNLKSMENVSMDYKVGFERPTEISENDINSFYDSLEESFNQSQPQDSKNKLIFERKLTDKEIGINIKANDFTVEELTSSNKSLSIHKNESSKDYVLDYTLDLDDLTKAPEATLKITMPAKITEANGASIKGNTAIFDLKQHKSGDILTVVSKIDDSSNKIILIGLGIFSIALISALIIISLRRKPKNSMTTPTDFNNQSANVNNQNTQSDTSAHTNDINFDDKN